MSQTSFLFFVACVANSKTSTMKPIQIAPHLHQIPFGFVNAYAITTPEKRWVLVDTGLKLHFTVLQSLEVHFDGPPLGIFLTHGHLDHAGSARELAEHWNIKIYASEGEKPFLTGRSIYPPYDPTVGGALAQMVRVFPNSMLNLTGILEILPTEGSPPFLHDWDIIPTPGHSPGHISFWHESDRVLVAGDALCTADMDSYVGLVTQNRQFARGGSPFTPDWEKSRESVKKLADLDAGVVAAGHGKPISGPETPQQMRDFARDFSPPVQGRYVGSPAKVDENGRVSLPPAPRDDFAKNVAAIGGAAAVLVAATKLLARRK